MSWEPGPTAAEITADCMAVLVDKADTAIALLEKIVTALKLLYEASL